jgi:uncharacterized protein (TIGR03435 family)
MSDSAPRFALRARSAGKEQAVESAQLRGPTDPAALPAPSSEETMRMMIAVFIAVCGFAMLSAQTPVAGQTQGTRPSFEVAAVKINKSNDGRVMIGMQPGGRYTATNVPLRLLARNAYRLQDTQLVGGPDWISSMRFDVSAKAEGNPAPAQVQEMLQSLLAERFGLIVHKDTRELPVYALKLAREDGKLGPKLTTSTVDCGAPRERGTPPPRPAPSGPIPCAIRIAPGNLTAGGQRMSDVANTLSPIVNRNVVDRTNLTGRYDLELSWTPDQLTPGPGGLSGGGAGPALDPNAPSLFTAIQEQLGLKLDSDRAPIEVTVIDQAHQPTVD